MSHGENKGVDYACWVKNDNAKLRKAAQRKADNRARRIARRDAKYAASATRCTTEWVREKDDGTVVRWRGHNCPWRDGVKMEVAV